MTFPPATHRIRQQLHHNMHQQFYSKWSSGMKKCLTTYLDTLSQVGQWTSASCDEVSCTVTKETFGTMQVILHFKRLKQGLEVMAVDHHHLYPLQLFLLASWHYLTPVLHFRNFSFPPFHNFLWQKNHISGKQKDKLCLPHYCLIIIFF